MKFMMMYKPGKESTEPPTFEQMSAMGKLIEDWTKKGVYLSGDGLQPSSSGVRVRLSGEKLTMKDGPFSDVENLVSGYAIVRAKSKTEAIELAKAFLKVVGGGESEIRQMFEAP
jgi:hypothetical protein